ncbi:hypothetical protein [Steroidobacter cummioxidans]|uniref:hypothetical protein n=1 Tax=Steroidobacter cummioxidans TaxID=1803913 RepID=UPI000E3180BF|nr:hypothetical protein [Steroidobacter cummioxidans]
MNGKALTFLMFYLVPASAAPPDSCPISATASPVSYGRLHQIPTVAPNNDVSHTVITPGGMILHTPEMVAATDVLTVVARDQDALCFHLLTLAKDWHKCDIQGVASKESANSYLFADGSAAVRFTFIGEDQVDVAPIGTAYRSRCEPSGSIQRATYTLGGAERKTP